jgi:hypothetical protein
MHGSNRRSIRRISVAALLVAAAIGIAALLASGAVTSSARAGSPKNGLSAYVVASLKGPIPVCSADCPPTNTVWEYVHVINSNPLTVNRGGSRATVPNAFVINSVDQQVSVDGADYPSGDGNFAPPPNVTPFPSASGRWPATVVCSGSPPSPPPCTDIQNPAVLPGENTIGFYAGWSHDPTDRNGTFVFTYTIHGTLNGNPVDLTASSPAIQMTG